MNIFVSSVAFKNPSLPNLEKVSIEHDLSIEFSANFEPNELLKDQFNNSKIDRVPHNYFPPPNVPFVLNLASQKKDVLKLSRDHCMQGIEMASKCRLKYYSAHAGFCLDPHPSLLGKKLKQPEKIDRRRYWDTFIESCFILSSEAQKMGVRFLFENNVLSSFNIRSDNVLPLLCVEPEEIVETLKLVNSHSFGFLLDTAHLKVSAQTLKFDKNEAIKILKQNIHYIHHSDNDGLEDSNQILKSDYWFLEYMPLFRDIPHIIEVKNLSIDDIKNQISLLHSSI